MTTEFERSVLALLRRALSSTLRNEAQGIDIMMKMDELATALAGVVTQLTTFGDQLTAAETQLEKAVAEIVDAIAAAGQTTPEVDAALVSLQDAVGALSGQGAAIAATAQTLDDINEDAPTP